MTMINSGLKELIWFTSSVGLYFIGVSAMQCILFLVLVLMNNCTLTLVLMGMYTVFILMNAHIPIKATSPDLKIKSIIMVHYTANKIKH